MDLPRKEYPRPQFVREEWLNLNGMWNFQWDDDNKGLTEKWFLNPSFSEEIVVPYAYQTKLSGIEQTEFHDIVWYHRHFTVPKAWKQKRLLLQFGAVDYRAEIWVNGAWVASHEGGHTSFYADITEAIQDGEEQQVVIRVTDVSTDLEQPRGKQFWEPESKGIFYTRTTGIWQTVWLEPVEASYLEKVKFTPDIDQGKVNVEYYVQNGTKAEVGIEVTFDGSPVASVTVPVDSIQSKNSVDLYLSDFENGDGRLWSPESPDLYDVTVTLKANQQKMDEVASYFGMRKITVESGTIKLNNQPYYMKLVLDQGYYPDSLLTAPTEEAIKQDIELTKQMGFNGVRKHQKVEEPRYLYWADRYGLLVWGEMANCHTFTEKAVKRITAEWQEAVERDYNHPSIVAWVPLNESWGVPRLKRDMRQKNHALSLYYLTKSLDQSRLVISNDGWEHVISDVLTIHDYAGEKSVLSERYSQIDSALKFTPADRSLYVKGFSYQGEPILVSEFGGIAYEKSNWKGWGYTSANSDSDFIQRYEEVVSALLESPLVQGFCYTQITDVEQEINGLLTYDRKPKVDLNIIRQINEGKRIELD